MMLLALFSWWYTAGWAELAKRVGRHVQSMWEFFSVTDLARTLFSPFHQISAGSVQGSFDTQMRAFGDRLFSRIFGAFVRTMFIFIAAVAAVCISIVGLVQLLLWPVLPLLPVIGVVLAAMGVTL